MALAASADVSSEGKRVQVPVALHKGLHGIETCVSNYRRLRREPVEGEGPLGSLEIVYGFSLADQVLVLAQCECGEPVSFGVNPRSKAWKSMASPPAPQPVRPSQASRPEPNPVERPFLIAANDAQVLLYSLRERRSLAADGLDFGNQSVEVNGLTDKSHDLEFSRVLSYLKPRREDQSGDSCQFRIGLLATPELPAIHERHHQIEKDDAGRLVFFQIIERLLAVGGLHDEIPLVTEHQFQDISDSGIILDYQNGFRSSFGYVMGVRGAHRFLGGKLMAHLGSFRSNIAFSPQVLERAIRSGGIERNPSKPK